MSVSIITATLAMVRADSADLSIKALESLGIAFGTGLQEICQIAKSDNTPILRQTDMSWHTLSIHHVGHWSAGRRGES